MNHTLTIVVLATLSLGAICYLANMLYKACIIIEHLEKENHKQVLEIRNLKEENHKQVLEIRNLKEENHKLGLEIRKLKLRQEISTLKGGR